MRELRAKAMEKPILRLSRRSAALLAVLAIAAIGAALVCYAYWPGIMIDDARWQYQQAIDNAYEDWHPPLMAWTWRQLMPLAPGPAPMFLLQLLLYWLGFTLIASAAQKEGHPQLAIALACLAYLPAPLALTGTVTKDALMTGALLVASGALLWRRLVHRTAARAVLASGAVAALFVAAALRFNAFFACVPLALVALPHRWTSTKPRLILSAFVATGAFLMTAPAIASLLQAEGTDVQLSLMIFDIGGITEHSGVSQFPAMNVRDPVAVNHRCYDPEGWDSYSDWAKNPCPLGFDAVQSLIDDDDLNPWRLWIGAIASHPLAYLEHRLTYFNLSSSFLVSSGPDFTAWSQSVPNPWGFHVRNNFVLNAISAVADGAARTPLGWPVFWIALGLGVFVAATAARLPEPIAIAASALLYGAGYTLVGVASGIRYYMWTFTGAALAAVLVAVELWNRRARLPRKALAASFVLVAAPTLIAAAARIALT